MVRIGSITVEITGNVSKLRTSLAQASSLIRDFSILNQGLTGGITSAFRKVGDVAIRGLQVGLAALGGSFAFAATQGAAFEDEITRAFVIMKEGGNATALSLYQMTQAALDMGRNTLFSATDAAEGMQVLARAGFNTREVLDSIGPVLNLAITDNLGLAESADFVISALRGFNMQTSESKRVTDVMALGASKASMSVSELGEAFKYVAPVAAGVGISFEETVAAIGILSDAGIKGSMAGTTLRRAFSELISPTKKSKEILDELGVNAVTSSGKLKSFAQIINDLKKSGMTAAQAMEVFGQRGGPGLIALLNTGSGALNALTRDLQNSQGAAERMAEAFRTTVKGRVKDLWASLVDLGLAFSEKFKTPLADAIFSLRNFVVDIVNTGNRMGIFTAIIKGIKDAMQPVMAIVGELAEKFKKWLGSLTTKEISEFFSAIKKAIEGLISSFKEGELGATIKDAFIIFITLGKSVIDTIVLIYNAWMTLPKGIRDTLRPLILFATIITSLSGGIINIMFFLVAINALWSALGIKITLVKSLMVPLQASFLFISKACLIIGTAVTAWQVGSFLGQITAVKSALSSIFILAQGIGPAFRLAAMALLAMQKPLLLFDKTFRSDLTKIVEELKIKAGAITELDWSWKKEGEEKAPIAEAKKFKSTGTITIGGKEIDIGAYSAQEELTSLKAMMSQAETIKGALGVGARASLLAGLQSRLNELEKLVMEQEYNLQALNRQNIKPESDRKNKPQINAGLQ